MRFPSCIEFFHLNIGIEGFCHFNGDINGDINGHVDGDALQRTSFPFPWSSPVSSEPAKSQNRRISTCGFRRVSSLSVSTPDSMTSTSNRSPEAPRAQNGLKDQKVRFWTKSHQKYQNPVSRSSKNGQKRSTAMFLTPEDGRPSTFHAFEPRMAKKDRNMLWFG